MRFKLDENMPADLKRHLAHEGHDVADVVTEGLGGAEDEAVVQVATAEHRVLMTFDLDFADIRHFPLGSHAGIIVFRLRDQRWKTLARPIRNLLAHEGFAKVERGLAIVDETRVRFKRSNE